MHFHARNYALYLSYTRFYQRFLLVPNISFIMAYESQAYHEPEDGRGRNPNEKRKESHSGGTMARNPT